MSRDSESHTPPANLPVLAAPPGQLTRSRDLLSYYLAQVRRYPLLSQEDERAAAMRWQEDADPAAAELLVTSNLRLVIKIAFQYHRQWANVLDLIQEGNMGLVKALSRYDPYREIRFSSYAQYWIRAMIMRFLLDNHRMVRLGSTRAGRKLFFQLQKERDRLIREGITPTTKLLAEAIGVDEAEVDLVDQHLRAPALSLDSPMGEDDGRPLSEMLAGEVATPEAQAAGQEISGILQEKLALFAESLADDRERTIWERRLIAQDPISLAELGETYGISKERVRQLEARIKKRLKTFLEVELGDTLAFEFENLGE